MASSPTFTVGATVAVVIPALDEEGAIGAVVTELSGALQSAGLRPVSFVADNGSTDRTSERARAAGATVVWEPRRGYGRACLAALAAVGPDVSVVLFADGDGADDPADVAALIGPILDGSADLVIGSRVLGASRGWVERGALTPSQRLGNRLAAAVLRVGYGQRTTDLGPFRAISLRALSTLRMDDPDFGWTVQMQARAARRGLRVLEVPVRWRRRRAGQSKVSGNVRAAVTAGQVILRTLWRERRW